ncbi:hypothetical protein H0H93_008868, partial [Arthromyces matolae]
MNLKASVISNVIVACLAASLALIAGASPIPSTENVDARETMHTRNVAFSTASSNVLVGASASVNSDSVINTKLTRREPLPPHPNASNLPQDFHNRRHYLETQIHASLTIIQNTRNPNRLTPSRINVMNLWEQLTDLDVQNLGPIPFENYKHLVVARMRAYMDIVTSHSGWNQEEKTAAAHCLVNFYTLLESKGFRHENIEEELARMQRAGEGVAMFALDSELNR